LQSGLDEIVRRHEVLRTIFEARDGKPEQIILGSARFDLRIVELAHSDDPRAELQDRLKAEARRPFDLGSAPLARVTLFRTSASQHVLLINFHHIISDAWSQGVFVRELMERYDGYLNGKSSSLPAPPIQYMDFALWQQDMIESEAGQRHLAYWKEKFRTSAKPLLLPSDRPRPHLRSYRGATHFSTLSQDLVNRLRDLSRGEDATLFMTLLAAFNVLLYRHTQEEDIVVGSPMANRERVETEELIGLFVNTHALRSNLSGDPSFRELLGRVREVVLEAYAHQEVPCEASMKTLPGNRAAAVHPLFQVVFGYQGVSTASWTLPGLKATRIELDTNTSKFDWTVLVTEAQDGIHLRSEFSTDLFESGTIMRLLHQFEILLESIAASPGNRISELALLTLNERDRLMVEWNQTGAEYERGSCIHEVFEAQVAKTPEAVALVLRGEALRYGDLNRRANQLARRLRDHGVGPGAMVGVCLERSFEMVIGILAVLKAGGTYVPMDVTLPSGTARVDAGGLRRSCAGD
jgi:hypothetical protein